MAYPSSLAKGIMVLKVGLGLFFFSLALALQLLSGAWVADIAGYDETAHYTTGVMLRMYVASLDWLHPIAFATTYYEHYPRVALGHWPPVFYIVQTLWTLPSSASRVSVMVLQAAITAACAFVGVQLWKKEIGTAGAIVSSTLFVLVPVVQDVTSAVMAEPLLTLWCLLSLFSYAAWLTHGRLRDSILFGCFASAAILTKASGFALAFVPPVAILLSRRFELLRSSVFWIPAAIVTVLCGPWYVFSAGLAKEGWTGSSDVRFLVLHVAGTNLLSLLTQLGGLVAAAAAIGAGSAILYPALRGRSVSPVWSVTGAALVATLVFHSFVAPVREARHLVLALAASLPLAVFGVGILFANLAHHRARAVAGYAVLAASFAIAGFKLLQKPSFGASAAAELLCHNSGDDILVASPDARGEGAIIAEMAMRQPMPTRKIRRASKVFAEAAWNNDGYRLLVHNPTEAVRRLRELKVSLLVLQDERREGALHYQFLSRVLKSQPQNFEPVFPEAATGTFRTYRLLAEAR